MSLYSALYDHLRLDSAIAALVSTRIYAHAAPTAEPMPYITFQRISENEPSLLVSASGLVVARVQIDCWGATPDAAESAGDAVRLSMQGNHQWLMGDENLQIHSSNLDGRRADAFEPDSSDDVWTHRSSLDFVIGYALPVPTFA